MAYPGQQDDEQKVQQVPSITRQQPASSGRFVNIQKYVQAGQGGVQRLGKSTQQNVGQQAQQAQQAQQQAQSAFSQAVDRSKQGITQQGAQQVAQNIQQTPGGLNPEQVAEAQKYYNAQYGGPQALSDIQEYGQAFQASERAKELGQLAQADTGRFELLRQQFKKPSYTRGQTALDTALLSSDQGVSKAIAETGMQTKATGEALTGQEQSATEQAQAAKTQLDDIRQQTQALISGETGKTTEEVQSELQRLQAERDELLPQLQAALSKGEISSDLLSKTNLGELAGQELYGADLGAAQLVGPELSAETVASKEQAARLNALQRIAGQQPGFREDLAGSVDRGQQFKYDVGAIQQRAGEQKAAYEKELSAKQKSVHDTLAGSGKMHKTIVGQQAGQVSNEINKALKGGKYDASIFKKAMEIPEKDIAGAAAGAYQAVLNHQNQLKKLESALKSVKPGQGMVNIDGKSYNVSDVQQMYKQANIPLEKTMAGQQLKNVNKLIADWQNRNTKASSKEKEAMKKAQAEAAQQTASKYGVGKQLKVV